MGRGGEARMGVEYLSHQCLVVPKMVIEWKSPILKLSVHSPVHCVSID